MMKLSEVLVPDAAIFDLQAKTKDDVLQEILAAMVGAGRLGQSRVNDILDALKRRERLGTTGVGKGIAVPHAKHGSIEGIMGAIAHSCAGVDFASLDNEPVYTVFLLLASPSATSEHLAALERISAIVRDDDYWRFLRDAKSKEEIGDIIREADAGFGD